MNDRELLRTGAIGLVIAATCCFTPALPLGALGLSAWLAWLNFIFLPLLFMFAAIVGFALFLRISKRNQER